MTKEFNMDEKSNFLTPHQSLQNKIKNDARNIRDMKRYTFDRNIQAIIIADCAKRLFEARIISQSLIFDAEENLECALEGWIE